MKILKESRFLNDKEREVWNEISWYDRELGLVTAFDLDKKEFGEFEDRWLDREEKDELRSEILERLPHLKGDSLERVLDCLYIGEENIELERIGYKAVMFFIVREHKILGSYGMIVKEDAKVDYIGWAKGEAMRRGDLGQVEELSKDGVNWIIYKEDGKDLAFEDCEEVVNVFSLFC